MACPLKNTPEYQELVAEYGEGRVLAAWTMNGENTPTVEQARELLHTVLAPIQAIDSIVKGFKSLQPKYLYGRFIGYGTRTNTELTKVAKEIAKWIEGKPTFSGIQVFTSDEGVLKFRDRDTGKFYQLEDINDNNIKQIKHELQSTVLDGFSSKAEGNTIQTALNVIREVKRTNEKGLGEGQKVQRYWSSIKEGGLEYTGEKGKKLFQGAEHIVYETKGKGTVLKENLNMSLSVDLLNDYLEGLLIYNWLFPNTAYSLQGFIKEEGQIRSIVEQLRIEESGTIVYDQKVIDNILEKSGFVKDEEGDYTNKELGIKLGDIRIRNVLFKEGIPFFIDPMIYLLPEFYKRDEQYSQLTDIKDTDYELQSTILQGKSRNKEEDTIQTTLDYFRSEERADRKSNAEEQRVYKRIEEFITSVGGYIKPVSQIVVDGQVIPANVVADVLSRTIEIVHGRATADTLPEEAAHIYVHWLPESSVLRRQMMKEIKSMPVYSKTMKQYSSRPEYQNADGTVNEEKIALEAIGKAIAAVITGKSADKKIMTWWQKMLAWLKNVFTDKDFNAFKSAAHAILNTDASKLDMKAMKEANSKGEYYFSLAPEDKKLIDKQLKNATVQQKEAVEKLIVAPENRVILEKDTHTYTDDKGQVYQSTTERINGNSHITGYDINRQWGEDIDSILQAVILKTPISKVVTPTLSDDIRDSLYLDMAVFVRQLTADGSIAFTQVTVATPFDSDPSKRVAGSIDLLLVHPDGSTAVVDLKTSWHSIHSTQHLTPYSVGEGPVLTKGAIPMQLNKKMKHSIQVGSYAKMLSLMGFNVRDTMTKHIYLHTQADRVNEYEDEGLIIHEDSENRTFVDAVIPGQWEGKQAISDNNPLHNEEPVTDEQLAEDIEKIPREFTNKVANLYTTTQEWKKVLEAQRHNTAFKPLGQSIEAVDRLLTDARIEFEKNADYSTAYTVFLDSAIEQLSKILPFISKKDSNGNLANADRDQFRGTVSLAAEYINTYKGLYHIKGDGTTVSQDKKYKKLLTLLEETAIAIDAAQQYMADKDIDRISVNKAVKDQLENSEFFGLEYKSGFSRTNDIGPVQTMAGSLGGNTVLDITQKKISDVKETARERTEIKDTEIDRVANNLKAAGVDTYDFMMETDKDGVWTGHIVTNIGPVYKEMRAKVEEPLVDIIIGERYQYKVIKDLSTASKEDIDYNKDLWAKKQAYGKFMNPKTVEVDPQTGDIEVKEGKYHRYTDSFIKERDTYMYVDVDFFGNSTWKFRSTNGMPQKTVDELVVKYPGKSLKETWKIECEIWREKNYNYAPYTTLIRDKNGKPTGVTKEVNGDAAWFPKQGLTQPRETASDGTKLAPEKYLRMMNPAGNVERAQSEYYHMYVKMMTDELAHLPSYATYWFQKGNVPGIQANMLDMLADKGANTMTTVMSQMTPSLPKGYISGKGEMITGKSIPVAFINSVQDINRLQELNKELQDLVAKKGTISDATYDKRFKDISDAIKIEEGKMTASKLHKDLTLGLKAFIGMGENFHAMSEVEQDILDMKSKILKMEFEQNAGLFGDNKKIVKGAESRTYERFKWFLDNEFYSNSSFNKSMLEHIVNKLMNVTSGIAIGFNVTGMVNNVFIASLNNSLESWGSDFYNRKSYQKAQRLFTTEFIPGYISSLGQYKSRDKSKDFYGDKKAGSKYEAMVHHFNMINHQHDIHNGKVSWLGKLWGYMGYEAGEYMVQSQIGISVLDSIMVTNATGEELSVYDAYDFDPNTGYVHLKKGYSIESTQKHDITHRIWKTNERIHGNYRWKVMLEKYTVGRLALQFHKWIYPNYKQRFQKAQFDESLGGGMDIEGRYTTLWNFSKSLIELKDRTAAWGKLSKLQRNNLKKDLADALYVSVLVGAYYLIKKIADGIPDDDPYLKKMANWMSKEADRGSQELSIFIPAWGIVESYQLIKNPFAVTSSLMKFNTLMLDAVHYPFPDDEKRYYQKGVFTGQLKISKDMKDLIPILREVNEWHRLDQQTNFYIR